jgi:hypothetical protein
VSVYRDDASGLAARLADLRAAWVAKAADVPEAAQDAFVARMRRLWAGRVGVASVAVMVAAIVVSICLNPDALLPMPERGHHDLGLHAASMMVGLVLLSLLVMAGLVVAKLFGYVFGDQVAKRRLRRLLAGETQEMDPVRALAFLAEETPRRVLLEEAQRLERATVLGHVASAPWPTFMLVFMFLARILGDARGVWLQYGLFMGAAWLFQAAVGAMTLYSMREPGAWSWWRAERKVWAGFLGFVMVMATIGQLPAFGWLLGVHVVTVGFRAHWVRRDVLRERAALC